MDRREAAERLRHARLYAILDLATCPLAGPLLEGGADLIQLRDKEASDEDLVSAGAALGAVCHRHDALFVMNDRPDLALECGADGVHVGQDDEPVESVRELAGDRLVVGQSTHTRAQVDAAEHADVDYFAVGPVHETPTKPGRPAVGLALVRYAAERARKPWFAIGGIDTGNAHHVIEAGAERIVVVRALTEAGDPLTAARALRAVAEGGAPGG